MSSGICPVCAQPIPQQRRKASTYCSDTCRQRAAKRRKRNQPIADVPVTAEAATETAQRLQIAERKVAKLEKLVKRQRQISRKQVDTFRNAADRIATARKRQAEAEADKAAALAHANDLLLHIEQQRNDFRNQCEKLQEQMADYQDLKMEVAQVNSFVQTKMKELEAAAATLALQSRELTASQYPDYLFFAQHYFRTKDRSFWTQADTSRLKRYQAAQSPTSSR